MRVNVVDPAAYTPPYDHALCARWRGGGRRRARHERASRTARCPPRDGYRSTSASTARADGPRPRAGRAWPQHVPDMLRTAARPRGRRRALPVARGQQLDRTCCAPTAARSCSPPTTSCRASRVAGPARRPARALRAHGRRRRPLRARARAAGRRARRRPRAARARHPARRPRPPRAGDAVRCRPSCADVDGTGGAVLRAACARTRASTCSSRRGGGSSDAELWVVGAPRMDTAPLRAAAPPGVRFVERFVERRARPRRSSAAPTSPCCPTARSSSPACSFTALAFGVPLVLSDVGGFPEVAAAGAAELVPPGDAAALHAALAGLLADPRGARALAAARAAAGRRGATRWDADRARATSTLYDGAGAADRGRRRLLGLRRRCSSTRRSATRCCCGCSRRAAAAGAAVADAVPDGAEPSRGARSSPRTTRRT